MKFSRALFPTRREDPAEAEVVSHKLMIRAGMIRKLAAGIYTLLPLGLRVQRKVEDIVREEMDRRGAQELLLPALSPAELWRESGRWDVYGKELMRLKDRHNCDFCLGPTHEEVVTDLIRREVRSYRQMPLNLYQIQTKFRDEVRPRFGVMRCREFTMKDAYSFDRDEVGAEESYRKMYEAYSTIFRRCGLDFCAVEAETGPIGGSFSHEFMVLAETGEEAVGQCPSCSFAANIEKVPSVVQGAGGGEPPAALTKVHTPGLTTVEQVSSFLGVPPGRLAKTLIFLADGQPVAAMVPGDRSLSEAKLKREHGALELELADAGTIEALTGAPVGFSGPVRLEGVPILADLSLSSARNLVVGANELDYHLKGANPGRDFEVEAFRDLAFARAGDPCPECGRPIEVMRGIEVGHVFKLGVKYSEALGATYLDENGKERPVIMGCYGIGIGRTVAAAIEQHHDEEGIIWPMPIAPYQAIVLPLGVRDGSLMQGAEKLYRELSERGVEVLLDDRDERAGVKFKDADLMGIPLKVILGPRAMSAGVVEIKRRDGRDAGTRPMGEAAGRVAEVVEEALRDFRV